MGRLPRLISDGLIYHAINRGNNRAAIFLDARDFLTFLDALQQTKERYPWLHRPLSSKELEAVRRSLTSGGPYGAERWVQGRAKALGLTLTPRPRGLPRKEATK